MSAGSMIAARQKRYVRTFLNATAIDEDTAKPLDELGCGEGPVFRGMARRGILVQTDDDRWHVDQLAWTRHLERRRVAALGMTLLALVGLLLVVVLAQ